MTRKASKTNKKELEATSNELENNNVEDLLRFKLYFETVNDPIIVFEANDKFIIEKILDVNKITAERIGYTKEELFNIGNWRLIARKIFKDFERERENFSKEGYTVFNSIAFTKIGQEIPIEISVRLLEFNKKNIIITIVRDITERIELNKKLTKQKEELSEFAHTTAHNLRNPLIAINGYIKLLEKNFNEKYLEKITQLTHKMVEMIDKSLQLADSGTVLGQIETIDMNFLVKSIIDTIDTKNINIEIGELPKLKGNPTKVSILFENLLNNAITHGKAKNINISNKTNSESYKITISNDGLSFRKDAIDFIFKKRFTTKSNGYGGHGLLIVQKIVEAHNWKIELAKKPLTTFIITIPKIEN